MYLVDGFSFLLDVWKKPLQISYFVSLVDRIQRDGELVVPSKDKNPSGHTVEENQADPRHLNVRSYFLYGIPAEVLVTELYQSADLDGRDVSYVIVQS